LTNLEHLVHYCEGLFASLEKQGYDLTYGKDILFSARADIETSDGDAPPWTDADAPEVAA
jgi:hypothetical protein